jgi:hypothetical protein
VGRLATLRNEISLDVDIVHVTRPNQQRIGCVRGALIAVSTPFDHQAQIVVAGEVHGGSDILSVPCGDGVNTEFGGPGVDQPKVWVTPGLSPM